MTTAVAEFEPNVLRLPKPIGLQPQWLASTANRKVLRVGRRGTKTRFAMLAAIAGHGSNVMGEPTLPGILQGKDVLWVAVDYPQLTTVLWKEELLPRFQDLAWATLNSKDHDLKLNGLGTLFLRSSEALRGVRGMGKNLCGIVIDEAAHFDLEGSLLNEVLPTLLDNGGWLIIMSTTNAGPDGNSDKRVPSFFNMLCEGIRAGESRYAGWEEFYGTAFDNPRISRSGIDELISFFPDGSPALEQEVYARLLRAGIGLALPQLDKERHMVPRFPVIDYWNHFGAFDWGFNHPWVFGHFTIDTDGNIYLIDTVWGREDEPDEIARKINAAVDISSLKYIVAGHDIRQQKGKAIGYHGPTIQETLHAHGIKAGLAAIDRVQGLDNMRRYLEWKPTEMNPKERIPRFRMMLTDGNRRGFAQLGQVQIDPKNLEDALKMDADSGGRGGDDFYDMLRYALMSKPLKSKMAVKYVHDGEEPHHDPAVKLTTKDGKPPKWIGPGDPEHDEWIGGYADQLPAGI